MAREQNPKSEFGEYLKAKIKEAKMSQYDFYTKVGIAKPYFYDMLSGRTNPPPRETQERMMDVLEEQLSPDEHRRTEFYRLAAIDRGEIPCDINDLIRKHPDSWDDIRKRLTAMFADEN